VERQRVEQRELSSRDTDVCVPTAPSSFVQKFVAWCVAVAHIQVLSVGVMLYLAAADEMAISEKPKSLA
jgi:hypothetical protein